MKILPISKEKAIELLKSYNQEQSDMNHYLESAAVMKQIAKEIGEDEEYYEMLGLLHDVDWSLTKNDSKNHLTLAPEILRKNGFDEEFINIIVSHGYGYDCAGLKDKKREKKIEFILAASETITGLIHAYALMRGKKISDMEVSGLKKKFKDKAFAAGCNREIISEIEKAGISLDNFFRIAIEGIKNIKEQVGLE
ncbi:HDIG domain-containing protein [Candidatus Woesearchaeota archaeon]|nr:HDIG domain-containing protein [Candidatus Woesearchaeota archaeon]